ncbi:hypothetical protein [Lysobacter enzymogenes]|uniref:hypothetical protein n=1 Tax=Lysobacter enzymogenes TaxID=69 RepID=UPI0019D2249E|nr:hypothetical protein [Lysobacter enzymogenes]
MNIARAGSSARSANARIGARAMPRTREDCLNESEMPRFQVCAMRWRNPVSRAFAVCERARTHARGNIPCNLQAIATRQDRHGQPP